MLNKIIAFVTADLLLLIEFVYIPGCLFQGFFYGWSHLFLSSRTSTEGTTISRNQSILGDGGGPSGSGRAETICTSRSLLCSSVLRLGKLLDDEER